MALKLASNLKKKEKATGFDLKFTEGITYNLDELIANKSRSDASRGLVIEVKKSEVIAAKAITALRENLATTIDTTLNTDDVKLGISKIIADVYKEFEYVYNTTYTVPDQVVDALNFRINEYLKSLYYEYDIVFKVTVPGQDSLTISYEFVSDATLGVGFSEFYDIFSEKYAEYSNVSEGGLAISDIKGKIRVNPNDYTKYLLDDDDCLMRTNKLGSYKIKGSETSSNVQWEEGSSDSNESNQMNNIYDEINTLRNRIDNLTGGEISDTSLDTIKEIGERLKSMDRKPITMEVEDDY